LSWMARGSYESPGAPPLVCASVLNVATPVLCMVDRLP
jgi:hypothetical protein